MFGHLQLQQGAEVVLLQNAAEQGSENLARVHWLAQIRCTPKGTAPLQPKSNWKPHTKHERSTEYMRCRPPTSEEARRVALHVFKEMIGTKIEFVLILEN